MRKLILIISILQSFGLVNAQTPADVKKILKVTDTVGLKTLSLKFQENEISRKKRVANYLISNPKIKQLSINSNGSTSELIDVNGKYPIYKRTFNTNASNATRANYLNLNGGLGLNLNGENMTAYVWDEGSALTNHVEFGSRVTIGDTYLHQYHATHVMGTILASGIDGNAKGMAPLANGISNNWTDDLTEMTTATGNGMLLSNHSYGSQILYTPFFGAYVFESSDLDAVLFSAPFYLSVWSAGNDGADFNTESELLALGYDKLQFHQTAKNNLVVASINQPTLDLYGNVTDAPLSWFSSQGPTDDLRIKPDITGMGEWLYSTSNASTTSYASDHGTSMASPNVTGSLLLIQQHYNRLNNSFMRSATLKGLALHTADDIETTGPDAKTGWGLLNAKRATNVISDNNQFSHIKELTLTQGGSYSFTVESDGVNQLLASISWTDPANNNVDRGYFLHTDGNWYRNDFLTLQLNDPTPVLVNDLDIRVTKNGTTYFPYRLTSASTNTQADNTVDPFERVDIANATGSYTITVTHKGTLTNGSQNYSLIVSGVRNCISDRTITGSYSTYKTNSGTWIKSSGTTTVVGDKKVILDANPNTGYVLLTPGFHAVPSNLGSFVARVVDGCNPYNYRLKSAVISESFDQANSYEDSTIFGIQIENDLFTISPNPANDNIRLTSSKTIMSLSIYNSFGLIVYSDNAVNETELSINISSFAPGIYFLHCDIDGKDIVKSIVKE